MEETLASFTTNPKKMEKLKKKKTSDRAHRRPYKTNYPIKKVTGRGIPFRKKANRENRVNATVFDVSVAMWDI